MLYVTYSVVFMMLILELKQFLSSMYVLLYCQQPTRIQHVTKGIEKYDMMERRLFAFLLLIRQSVIKFKRSFDIFLACSTNRQTPEKWFFINFILYLADMTTELSGNKYFLTLHVKISPLRITGNWSVFVFWAKCICWAGKAEEKSLIFISLGTKKNIVHNYDW